MTTRVGIRELKTRLSHYLDRAAAGETIVVTAHGRAKAELGPLSGDARLEQLVGEGRVVPGRRDTGRAVAPLRIRVKLTVEQLLAEDRGE